MKCGTTGPPTISAVVRARASTIRSSHSGSATSSSSIIRMYAPIRSGLRASLKARLQARQLPDCASTTQNPEEGRRRRRRWRSGRRHADRVVVDDNDSERDPSGLVGKRLQRLPEHVGPSKSRHANDSFRLRMGQASGRAPVLRQPRRSSTASIVTHDFHRYQSADMRLHCVVMIASASKYGRLRPIRRLGDRHDFEAARRHAVQRTLKQARRAAIRTRTIRNVVRAKDQPTVQSDRGVQIGVNISGVTSFVSQFNAAKKLRVEVAGDYAGRDASARRHKSG